MEKLLVLSNFFFFHYVFKKLSAAEASESIYMGERFNEQTMYKLLVTISREQSFHEILEASLLR